MNKEQKQKIKYLKELLSIARGEISEIQSSINNIDEEIRALEDLED